MSNVVYVLWPALRQLSDNSLFISGKMMSPATYFVVGARGFDPLASPSADRQTQRQRRRNRVWCKSGADRPRLGHSVAAAAAAAVSNDNSLDDIIGYFCRKNEMVRTAAGTTERLVSVSTVAKHRHAASDQVN